MEKDAIDAGPMAHIDKLVKEEHRLFELKSRTPQQDKKLKGLQIQLDQCWDLLRQRRAARETGHNPDDAHVRPPEVVEHYKGG
ncbi:MAG: DUF2630 family protein [Burkholderiales bacterium]|jgi:hypothetical protein|nr:DUF2630 family protein [Burkholderiales bacterium]